MAEISEVRVLVRVGPRGQKRLAAYVVGRQGIDRTDLRTRLGQFFPSYMIPHFIIAMPALPRNQNGKLDESQLPDPFTYSAEPLQDRNQVAACWEEILSRRVLETVNFLDAGGTSLEALRLTELLEKRFSVARERSSSQSSAWPAGSPVRGTSTNTGRTFWMEKRRSAFSKMRN
jgi:hypothetical protein